jgi:hypothetical protein
VNVKKVYMCENTGVCSGEEGNRGMGLARMAGRSTRKGEGGSEEG